MARSVTIYFPPKDHDWYRTALEMVANDLVSDDEAGQRGTKVSVFVQMLLTAYIRDGQATVEILRQVKAIAMDSSS